MAMIAFDAGQGQPASPLLGTRRLWSLWDMIKQDILQYVKLGREIQDFQILLFSKEERGSGKGIGPAFAGSKIEDLDPQERKGRV
jgi:hypothetical protein